MSDPDDQHRPAADRPTAPIGPGGPSPDRRDIADEATRPEQPASEPESDEPVAAVTGAHRDTEPDLASDPEPEGAPETEPAPAAEAAPEPEGAPGIEPKPDPAPPAIEPAAAIERATPDSTAGGGPDPAAEQNAAPAADPAAAQTAAPVPVPPAAAEPANAAGMDPTPSGRPGLLAAPAGQPDAAGPEAPRSDVPRPGGPGRPGRRPGVVPRPRPAGTRPATPAVEPVVEPTDPHRWGRIDETGAVFVGSASGERQIGNWQAGDAEAGLAHYARRFDDFATEIAILEKRLANGSGDPKSTRAQAVGMRESVESLAAIGDLDSAAARLEIVIGAADAAAAGASQARTAARARAVAAKEALCAEAESLAESTSWKATGDRLKQIVEEWRAVHGIDRKTDDALWRRFAKARDTFTKHRGTHFADLDKQRGVAREAKEKLIARAQELSKSDDWGRTAGEYRTLMDEWKASGRAPREVEDQLWQRFRAAQEQFFSRRNSTFTQRDSEFGANAAAKEKLLVEAEGIDPGQGSGFGAGRAALGPGTLGSGGQSTPRTDPRVRHPAAGGRGTDQARPGFALASDRSGNRGPGGTVPDPSRGFPRPGREGPSGR